MGSLYCKQVPGRVVRIPLISGTTRPESRLNYYFCRCRYLFLNKLGNLNVIKRGEERHENADV